MFDYHLPKLSLENSKKLQHTMDNAYVGPEFLSSLPCVLSQEKFRPKNDELRNSICTQEPWNLRKLESIFRIKIRQKIEIYVSSKDYLKARLMMTVKKAKEQTNHL